MMENFIYFSLFFLLIFYGHDIIENFLISFNEKFLNSSGNKMHKDKNKRNNTSC